MIADRRLSPRGGGGVLRYVSHGVLSIRQIPEHSVATCFIRKHLINRRTVHVAMIDLLIGLPGQTLIQHNDRFPRSPLIRPPGTFSPEGEKGRKGVRLIQEPLLNRHGPGRISDRPPSAAIQTVIFITQRPLNHIRRTVLRDRHQPLAVVQKIDIKQPLAEPADLSLIIQNVPLLRFPDQTGNSGQGGSRR